MDRTLVYPGSVPLDTDLLNLNRNTMVALGALIQATLGIAPVVDGLAVAPTSGLVVEVGPGSITQITSIDANAYGSLPADTQDPLVKMGINTAPTFFTCAAPGTPGQSIDYLIEASFSESDSNPVILPYYNAANPTQTWLGPGNNGGAQPTLRQQRVALQLRGGAPATTGTQSAPSADPGWIALATVQVDFAMTTIPPSAITPAATTPSIPYKLPSLRPGLSQLQAFGGSGTFVVPTGVTRARVTVTGGGGAGGTHASQPGGGGGAGGTAIAYVNGLIPGTAVAVTVGAAGQPITNAQGGAGGTSSFGPYVSATGGQGGGGGTAPMTCAGGSGGQGVGGNVAFPGAYGTDGITLAQRGGDGGGPGGGRGTSGLIAGIAAPGWGGGGGGGGASAPNGTGTGALGGAGGGGLVIVEF